MQSQCSRLLCYFENSTPHGICANDSNATEQYEQRTSFTFQNNPASNFQPMTRESPDVSNLVCISLTHDHCREKTVNNQCKAACSVDIGKDVPSPANISAGIHGSFDRPKTAMGISSSKSKAEDGEWARVWALRGSNDRRRYRPRSKRHGSRISRASVLQPY